MQHNLMVHLTNRFHVAVLRAAPLSTPCITHKSKAYKSNCFNINIQVNQKSSSQTLQKHQEVAAILLTSAH